MVGRVMTATPPPTPTSVEPNKPKQRSHTDRGPGKSRSGPEEWDEIDHLIYEARIFMRLTWRQVGQKVGLHHTSARERFMRRMSEITPADVETMRAEENEKLDDLELKWNAAHARAIQVGDLMAEARALTGLTRAQGQRARLNGLEVPVSQEISVTFETVRTELDSRLDEFLAGVIDTDTTDATNRGSGGRGGEGGSAHPETVPSV